MSRGENAADRTFPGVVPRFTVSGTDRPPQPAAKIVATLERLGRAQRTHRITVATGLDLVPLQLEILYLIADGAPPDPVVGSIASELGVSQPTVTDSLIALERKGLIRREADRKDRRRTRAMLTAEGDRVVLLARTGESVLAASLDRLGSDQQGDILSALLAVAERYVEVGVIGMARTCLTCKFHRSSDGGADHCVLLGIDLAPVDLRINCAEHIPLVAR